MNENLQALEDMAHSENVDVADNDKTCSNGYTPKEISDAMVDSLVDLSKVNSAYGDLINIETAALTAFYGKANPFTGFVIGTGYKMVVGALLTNLNNKASDRLMKEYKDAMATCT